MIYEGESNLFTLLLSPLFAGISVANYITEPISETESYNKIVEYIKELFKTPIKKIKDKIENWYPSNPTEEIELNNYEIKPEDIDNSEEKSINYKKYIIIASGVIVLCLVYTHWESVSPVIVSIYGFITGRKSGDGPDTGDSNNITDNNITDNNITNNTTDNTPSQSNTQPTSFKGKMRSSTGEIIDDPVYSTLSNKDKKLLDEVLPLFRTEEEELEYRNKLVKERQELMKQIYNDNMKRKRHSIIGSIKHLFGFKDQFELEYDSDSSNEEIIFKDNRTKIEQPVASTSSTITNDSINEEGSGSDEYEIDDEASDSGTITPTPNKVIITQADEEIAKA